MSLRFSIRLFLTMLLPMAAVACHTIGGTVNFVHKTGSTVQQRSAVIDACQVKALQDVPPSYRVRSTGGFYSFGSPFCSRRGFYSCHAAGGNIYSYDPNDRLRARQFGRCLSSRGYTLAAKPVCSSDADIKAYKSQGRQAPLARLTCVSGEPRLERRWTSR